MIVICRLLCMYPMVDCCVQHTNTLPIASLSTATESNMTATNPLRRYPINNLLHASFCNIVCFVFTPRPPPYVQSNNFTFTCYMHQPDSTLIKPAYPHQLSIFIPSFFNVDCVCLLHPSFHPLQPSRK